MELYHGLERFDPSNREGHSARIYFNTLFGNDLLGKVIMISMQRWIMVIPCY